MYFTCETNFIRNVNNCDIILEIIDQIKILKNKI
jgi:hypothetical protein